MVELVGSDLDSAVTPKSMVVAVGVSSILYLVGKTRQPMAQSSHTICTGSL